MARAFVLNLLRPAIRANGARIALLAACLWFGQSPASDLSWPFGGGDTTRVATKVANLHDTFVVGGLDFNSSGMELATNGQVAGPEVHVWNWRAPNRGPKVLPLPISAGGGEAIRFGPDGSLLAVGHVRANAQNGYELVRVWNSRDWSVAHSIAAPEGGDSDMGLAFTPDGKALLRTVLGRVGSQIRAHSTDTWEQTWSVDASPIRVNRLVISPDGRYAAASGVSFIFPGEGLPVVTRMHILVLDLTSHQIIRDIPEAFPDHSDIRALAWSPDGKAIAAGVLVGGTQPGPDAVRLFDPSSGEVIAKEAAGSAGVYGLAYTPNGRYLIEDHVEGEVRIWDAAHQHLLQSFRTNPHFYTPLSISPDSHYFAIAAGPDVSVWQLK